MMHLLARIYDYSKLNNYSVLLAGDFNTESNSETCKSLLTSGYDNLSNPQLISYPKRNCTIDFIFGLHKRFKCINQTDLSSSGLNFYSDHNPVCCLIEIMNSNIIPPPQSYLIQQQQQQIPTSQLYSVPSSSISPPPQQQQQHYTVPIPQQRTNIHSRPLYPFYQQQQQQQQQLPRSVYLSPQQMVISNQIASNPPPVLNSYKKKSLYPKQPVYASNVVKKPTGYLPSQYSQPPQPIRYK